ncbi:hypothetical protein GCM10018780_80550 [Streptomyces lanatus]|nr:hypothetical protein GCM10018780_80550 [Streptomyces lanatus]
MRVRSLDGVKYISRSLPGMNHLGSGHVLMNKPASQPGWTDLDQQRETVSTPQTHYGTFAAKPAAASRPGKKFLSGRSRERERFGAGWMLTLVRQLVELEKRRRDYCSDPREPADGR